MLTIIRHRQGVSLILNRQLPPTSGYASITQNIGGLKHKVLKSRLNGTIVDNPDGLKWTAEFNLG
jgi:hypothetical protein